MTNPTLDPIDNLTRLSAQLTARTDRLHAAVTALTTALETAGARTGEIAVTVDGWSLSYNLVRSNVGQRPCWSFVDAGLNGCTDLDLAVGHDGYLHGDFNAPITGPSRAHLIAFGRRAERYVAAIARTLESEIAACDSAIESVDTAAKSLA